jgi:hypothetical protein
MSYFQEALGLAKTVWKLPGRIRAWLSVLRAQAKKLVIDLVLTAAGIILTDPVIVLILAVLLIWRYLHDLLDVDPQYW